MKNLLLLLCSYAFYFSFDWRFGWLLLLQTAICYYLGLAIRRQDVSGALPPRRFPLVLGCMLSFGTLFFFKYYNFCNDSFHALFSALGLRYLIPHLHIILPVGISFFIFQTVGYLIDVYRGDVAPERDPILFSLFASFFPQLAAGPIGRSRELLPQFRHPHSPSCSDLEDGISLILWGLFKKAVIADRLAVYVDMIYRDVVHSSSPSLLLAVVFFSIQIYCDFSGYSDIAVGSGRLFGISLRENFDFPYLSSSINGFWKRWHISLTSWFRDYLYIPLGGNRCSSLRRIFNVLAVFLVSGLWHGAAWTFIFWGAIHGIFQLAETAVCGRHPLPYAHRITRLMGMLWTFGLVTFAWIFFRSPDLGTATTLLRNIIHWHGTLNVGASQVTFALNILLIALFAILEACSYLQKRNAAFFSSPVAISLRNAFLLSAVALLGQSTSSFIYLQF